MTPRYRPLLQPLALIFLSPLASADLSFTNIAADPSMNLQFERTRSLGYAQLLEVYESSQTQPLSMPEVFASTAHRPGGFSGVALIDYDNDGDIDIYATNGPGGANGLFRNRLRPTGQLGFDNVSATSGAAATDLDSNGVCFGDLDNDGDDDLYVLGRETENRLYENLGGAFREVAHHGAQGGALSHISCAMGDVDGDGLLDIAVSNIFDLSTALALVAVPYDLNHPNQLFRNRGGLQFEDVSSISGIRNMNLGGTTDPQPPTISWAVSMVDIDRDGDTDVIFGDDQAALPNAARGGFDRGYLQIFLNDGSGHFTNAPIQENTYSSSAWMGLGFGDLNCDGALDIFATNLGDYMFPALNVPSELGSEATRALLGRGDGSFDDPGAQGATAFGWGNAVADLDNDGDQDVLYQGAMDLNLASTHDNPGVVLENQECSAQFTEHLNAFRGDYTLRGTQGVAAGDLDQDGYVDVVTAAEHIIPETMPFFISPAQFGSALDATARFYLPMIPDPNTGLFAWGGQEVLPGNIAVEINNGEGQASVAVKLLGSKGITSRGGNNRSAIGAILSFTPRHGKTVSAPIAGGSSFLSQHALEAHFGMGDARSGTLDIQWPGGVRNRLYAVRAGERLRIPEIPCSITTDERFPHYLQCLNQSLAELKAGGEINRRDSARLLASAVLAYFDR